MAVQAVKKERIDLRATEYDKDVLERAAELKQLSLSAYIIAASLKQAQIDLLEQETLLISLRERDLLMSALENPPEPTEALKGLFS